MPAEAKPTLLLIDGHSLAFRAFYALPVDSFQTADGQHTNAIHGFISMMLNLLAKEKPTHMAVAFDISRYSFRTKEYPEYKGTRGETPAEFIGQVPLLQDALHAMNITTLTKEDYEADDILATLATRGRAAGHHVLVVSGDRDTIQLVNDDVTLLYPSKQGVSELTRYNAEKVMERYGVRPEQYPEIAALVGETSDNLPGVPKVGEKTAVKWITQYGSLDEILAHRDEIPGVVGNNLREFVDNVTRNRRLNHLVTDVDLPVEPNDLAIVPMNVDAVRDVFAKLEFRSLLDRVLKLAGVEKTSGSPTSGSMSSGESTTPASTPGSPPTPADSSTSSSAASQTSPPQRPGASPVSRYPAGETLPAAQGPAGVALLDEELAQWLRANAADEATPIAVSVEMYADAIVSVGLATAAATVLVPIGAVRQDIAPLVEWCAGPTPKSFHGSKAALKSLAAIDIDVANIVHDTELAAWIMSPDVSNVSLATVVTRTLGEVLPEPHPDQLIDENAVSVDQTAWHIARISLWQREAMTATELGLLGDIELPTARALAAMESRGVSVSRERLATLGSDLSRRAQEFQDTAFGIIGREVNLSSPKQLQDVLFVQLQMPPTKKMKTGFTTDAAALADLQISNPHPFLDALMGYRETTKLKQMVETLTVAIGSDERIHTSYVQTGTSTGRLSSANPNLQNIPVRSEDGRGIREAFQAGPGYDAILTADYSQIEMRIMAHFSQDAGLIEAFTAGEDLHRFVGARIFGVDPSDVTSEMRTKVKAMSYGLAYGLSAFGLARQLRIDNKEAKTLMADYFERFGGVRDYLRSVVEEARDRGYTETLFGRRRPFPDLTSPNHILRANAERQALNAPMQGTAADIMKVAMNRIEEQLVAEDFTSRLLMQVHDELLLEVTSGEEDRVRDLVTHHMSTAASLSVPLDVQVGRGRTWNEAAH
jgi:DNA polymerase-1